jgi:hypothetical protein
MNKNIVRSALTALALGATLATSMAAPAMADQTSTRNIILGAAAAIGIATAVNVEHKHQLATTVQGYLPDGSTVYQDGHVVSQNGQTWYPGNYGQNVACSNQYCTISGGNGYGRYGYNGYGSNGYGYNYNYNGTRRGNDKDADDNGHRHHG